MSEAYYWKPDGWYMNCEILKRWMSGEDYQYTSPSLPTFYNTRDKVLNAITAAGGCTPDSMFLEGELKVTEVNLPDELDEGELILGNVRVKNIGDIKDIIRCKITTGWDGALYQSSSLLDVDSSKRIYFMEHTGVVMPARDAMMTIVAQHYHTPTLSWRTDEVVTH